MAVDRCRDPVSGIRDPSGFAAAQVSSRQGNANRTERDFAILPTFPCTTRGTAFAVAEPASAGVSSIMQKAFIAAAVVAVCSAATTARAQSTNRAIQGFGGITFGTSSTPFLGGTSTAPTFGGAVVAGLLPNLQVVGEFGRMSDIKPPLFDLVDEYAPVGLHVTAWYGEGGVRWIASPHSSVRPYGEATAGWARLNTDVSGFGGRGYEVVEEALGFLNHTDPLLGVGGGVVFQAGALAIDVGYRYKKILASGAAAELNGGDYHVNDVRVGVGFSF